MEEQVNRVVKTKKFSEKKLQSIMLSSVCTTLRFDVLNLQHDIEGHKDFINPSVRILNCVELVQQYAFAHGEEIGEILENSVKTIFSYEELSNAFHSNDHSPIYEKLYEHIKHKRDGNTITNEVLSMMLEYRVEGFKEEEQNEG